MKQYLSFGIFNYSNVERILNEHAINGWQLKQALIVKEASEAKEVVFVILEKEE